MKGQGSMTEHFIDLTDGTRVEVKLNFGTLYYLQKCKGYYRIAKKAEMAEKKGIPTEKALSEAESFEMAANIIYAILRSNGRVVKFDEALSLVPVDTKELKKILEAFQKSYEKYAKKKQAKTSVMPE